MGLEGLNASCSGQYGVDRAPGQGGGRSHTGRGAQKLATGITLCLGAVAEPLFKRSESGVREPVVQPWRIGRLLLGIRPINTCVHSRMWQKQTERILTVYISSRV